MTRRSNAAANLDRRELLKGVAAAGLASRLGELSAAAPEDATKGAIIEGYTGQLSYQAGDTIGFHISTTEKKSSREIARIGARREVVATQRDLPGVRHPIPEQAAAHGCKWPVAWKLTVPQEWQSGYYSVQ